MRKALNKDIDVIARYNYNLAYETENKILCVFLRLSVVVNWFKLCVSTNIKMRKNPNYYLIKQQFYIEINI